MSGFDHIKIDKVDIKEGKCIHIIAHSIVPVSKREIEEFKENVCKKLNYDWN